MYHNFQIWIFVRKVFKLYETVWYLAFHKWKLKAETSVHATVPVPVYEMLHVLCLQVLQATLQAGFLTRISNDLNVSICDQFFLGGPLSLRGFNTRGVGPHRDGNALGASVSNGCTAEMMNLILIRDLSFIGSWFDMVLVCESCP